MRGGAGRKKLDYCLELQDVWAADTAIARPIPGQGALPAMEGGGACSISVEYLTRSPAGKLHPQRRPRTRRGEDPALADGLDAGILPGWRPTWCNSRSDERALPAWTTGPMEKLNAALAAMDQGLGDKPYCSGIHLSLSDIAVGCALGWLEFRYPELAWRTEYPNLGKLMDKLMQRASFADTSRAPDALGPRALPTPAQAGAGSRCGRRGYLGGEAGCGSLMLGWL